MHCSGSINFTGFSLHWPTTDASHWYTVIQSYRGKILTEMNTNLSLNRLGSGQQEQYICLREHQFFIWKIIKYVYRIEAKRSRSRAASVGFLWKFVRKLRISFVIYYKYQINNNLIFLDSVGLVNDIFAMDGVAHSIHIIVVNAEQFNFNFRDLIAVSKSCDVYVLHMKRCNHKNCRTFQILDNLHIPIPNYSRKLRTKPSTHN